MENIVALYRSESLEAYFEPVELPHHGHGARTFGHKESCSIAVLPQFSPQMKLGGMNLRQDQFHLDSKNFINSSQKLVTRPCDLVQVHCNVRGSRQDARRFTTMTRYFQVKG